MNSEIENLQQEINRLKHEKNAATTQVKQLRAHADDMKKKYLVLHEKRGFLLREITALAKSRPELLDWAKRMAKDGL